MARTLPELIAAVESLRDDYQLLQDEIWEHEPMLPGCEYRLGDPISSLEQLIDYLTEEQSKRESEAGDESHPQ